MSKVVISVENLSKVYRLGQIGTGTFANDLKVWWARTRGVPNPLLKIGESDHGNRDGEEVWALKDVSFTVEQGEVLGIIGRNGAGKSTLLKILSRITAPTSGRVRVKGRIASLLEVGTGFHPELTGRENIFLNGAILGMSKAEIARKFDEIVDFSGVEKFIDTPVKHYSSGMYVRLAFAVAAHLEPEILVVDEVLAVGDAEFQKKCLGKMGDIAKEGRTILFVSHNLIAVRTLCDQGIVLNNGHLQFMGLTIDSVTNYLAGSELDAALSWNRDNEYHAGPLYFHKIRVDVEGKQPRLVLRCDIALVCIKPGNRAFVAIDIVDSILTPIMQAIPNAQPFITGTTGIHHIQVEIEIPPLIPGVYLVSFWVGTHYTNTLDYIKNVISFEIDESPTSDRVFPHSVDHGLIAPIAHYKYQSPDYLP